MMFVLVFSMTFNALAVNLGTGVGSYDGAPNVNQMMALYNKYVGGSYAYYYYHADSSYSGRSNCAWFGVMPSNYVLVKRSTTSSSGNYYTNLYYLDENGNVTWADPSNNVVYQYLPDSGGTFSYNTNFDLYVTSDNKVCCNGQYDLAIESNIPIASTLDNAAMFLKTGDAAYLDNGVLFEDVERPINVALYKASEEGNYYLYWENDGVTEEAKKKYTTFIRYELKYQDAGGNSKYIKDPYSLEYPFEGRFQVALDYSDLLLYDSSYVRMYLYNGRNLGTDEDPNWAYSDEVCIEIPLNHSDSYYITLYDKEGTPIKTNEYVLNDYGTKNESFTGGTPVDIPSNIPSAGSGDYGFFNYLMTGFGLLGDNGLLALVGKLFSFLPVELFARIEYGIYALVAVGVFKLFIKS